MSLYPISNHNDKLLFIRTIWINIQVRERVTKGSYCSAVIPRSTKQFPHFELLEQLAKYLGWNNKSSPFQNPEK